jgi:glycosyltransferase involved in cell wall biosynthesis
VNSPEIENNRPLRIALISPYAHYAGHHWPTARELALALQEAGHEVDIITTTATIESPEPALAERIRFAWPGRPPSFLQSGTSRAHNAETLLCLLRGFQLQRSRGYDVWHVVDGTHVFLYLAALLARAPIVYHIWGEVSGYAHSPGMQKAGWLPELRSALLERALHRGKLAFVCETEETRRAGEVLFGRHIRRIPYAVRGSVVLADGPAARRNLGLPLEGFVLLAFGTHREGKDYDTVVRAARLARTEVHLLFAGKTISENDPAKVVAKYEYPHAVIVERFITAEEAPLYFAACDALVLPYMGNYQKGSYVLFEALQFRRPSIAADTGFLRQFIEENRCGFVYQPGDAGDLARVIDEAAGLSDGQKTALSSAIETAAERHSWKAVIQRYVRLYGEMLRQPAQS